MAKLEKEGVKKPKGSSTEVPTLWPSAEWVWEAFNAVSATRPRYDGVPQPITLSEILSYAHLEGINVPSQKSFLYKAILQMDDVWLSHEMAMIKKERDKLQNKSGKGKGVARRGKA